MTSRRAQRRSRAHQPTAQPILVGDGIVAQSTGVTEEALPGAQLPAKVPGKHRWICSAAYVVSDEMIRQVHDPQVAKFLDHESLFNLSIGCWDCEKSLDEIEPDSVCLAVPEEDGHDTWRPATEDETVELFPTEFDKAALLAAVDLVARSGGTEFQVSYSDEEPPRWYATALYKGTNLIIEDKANPLEAAEGLARRILAGGQCTHCHKEVTLRPVPGNSSEYCLWHREGEHWLRGCE